MGINCIIIDDEQHNLENLQLLLNKYCPYVTVLGLANSANQGIEMINHFQPDLVFLDIEMPNKNGFDMLTSLNKINFEIIFVTAYNRYALQAIKSCALDYLMKPLKTSELIEAVSKAVNLIEEKRDNENLKHLLKNLNTPTPLKKLALPTADETFFVPISDIIRCQGENNYTKFYLTNGTFILVSKTLKEWDELLSSYQFIRTHQSHLINSKYVQSFVKKDGGYILMSDGSTVSVSKSRKESTLQLLAPLK
jgi:two-component system LytT family response regulator